MSHRSAAFEAAPMVSSRAFPKDDKAETPVLVMVRVFNLLEFRRMRRLFSKCLYLLIISFGAHKTVSTEI